MPPGGPLSNRRIEQAILNNGSRRSQTENIPVSVSRIALTAPANGAQFAARAEIQLVATTTERMAAVEFFDGTASLGTGIAESLFSYRLDLTEGLSAGVHVLRVKATDSHGLIVWSPMITVTVIPSALMLTAVELIEPAPDMVYAAGSSLRLRATAMNPAGPVRRVEFYDEQILIGAVTTPASDPESGVAAYVFEAWIVDTPGVHHVRARAYGDNASFSESPAVAIRVVPTLPYAASFEAWEKYQLGSLQGQLGWKVVRGSAAISEKAVFDGVRAVELSGGPTGGSADQVFGPSVVVRPIFVDLAVRPAVGSVEAEGTRVDFDGARVAFVTEGSSGRFAVSESDQGEEVPVGDPLAIDPLSFSARWTRLTLRIDPQASAWDLFIDGRLTGYDLALDRKNVEPAEFHRLFLRSGAETKSYFDFLFAGYENPLFADADEDGMEDGWERANGLDPARDDRAGDRDADGLTNLEEFFRGTRADLADTDADGLPDAWEIRYGLDPLRPTSASSDADLDGLDDLREFAAGTNPNNPDSDGDGLPDGWEVTHGLDPLRADSAGDADGDGVSSLEEYRLGTDPSDFFDGQSPQIETPNGEEAGAEDELVLIARKPDGTPWANAPVTFRIVSGTRHITATRGRGPYMDVLELRADARGLAQVYLEPLEP